MREWTTSYATILTIYCCVQRKICLIGQQNVPRPFIVIEYSSQKIGCKIKTFVGICWVICCTKLILFGYHSRKDLKIFRTVDQGRDKSLDTARAIDVEYWKQDSLSTTAKATSIVSFEIDFLPLSHITSKSPVSPNFRIISFQNLSWHRTFSQTIQASIFKQYNR